ncbi:hypothetical protein M406DRAFT_351196 [Cryphonectria parasitica EP155]|uniref:Uncharacterized protein n=1 Tax=Cryphonectria parasitica (strain ATCC 38755 / EP155) TaxID=660469 RepID=A0A9P4Y3U0_CRYP1|nr:uncharacterized protein M406DRAFT_351196 [Cryphonectria parasitica EP155]KAF3765867.1 hypothetical protein M406DRAFT_351196 [Cryphonectria parasitica EP155]
MASSCTGNPGGEAQFGCDTPAAAADATRDSPPPEEGEDEVAFTHTVPAIFVPLKDDLLQPMRPAENRIEYLQRMRDNLDTNEKAVRENLAFMFEREARRRIAAAKKRLEGPLSVPHEPQEIGWDEAEKLFANVEAPANPHLHYHLSPEKLAEYSNAPVRVPAGLPPHERTARELLDVAHHGAKQMEAYSNKHVKNTSQWRWRDHQQRSPEPSYQPLLCLLPNDGRICFMPIEARELQGFWLAFILPKPTNNMWRQHILRGHYMVIGREQIISRMLHGLQDARERHALLVATIVLYTSS